MILWAGRHWRLIRCRAVKNAEFLPTTQRNCRLQLRAASSFWPFLLETRAGEITIDDYQRLQQPPNRPLFAVRGSERETNWFFSLSVLAWCAAFGLDSFFPSLSGRKYFIHINYLPPTLPHTCITYVNFVSVAKGHGLHAFSAFHFFAFVSFYFFVLICFCFMCSS